MKKKILFVICLLCIMIGGVTIASLARGRQIRYTEKGLPIVVSGEEIPDEIKGQNFALEVPMETPGSNGDDIADFALEETEIMELNSEMNTNQDVNEIEDCLNSSEIRELEEKGKETLYRYYGEQKIEELIERNQNESLKNGFIFPESGEELLEMMFDIIDNPNALEEEKESLIAIIHEMDLYGLKNEELKQKIENL